MTNKSSKTEVTIKESENEKNKKKQEMNHN